MSKRERERERERRDFSRVSRDTWRNVGLLVKNHTTVAHVIILLCSVKNKKKKTVLKKLQQPAAGNDNTTGFNFEKGLEGFRTYKNRRHLLYSFLLFFFLL